MTVTEFAEKAMWWAEKIKAYCGSRKTCNGCPFMSHNHIIPDYPTGCIFIDEPEYWGKC